MIRELKMAANQPRFLPRLFTITTKRETAVVPDTRYPIDFSMSHQTFLNSIQKINKNSLQSQIQFHFSILNVNWRRTQVPKSMNKPSFNNGLNWAFKG